MAGKLPVEAPSKIPVSFQDYPGEVGPSEPVLVLVAAPVAPAEPVVDPVAPVADAAQPAKKEN